LQGEIDLARLYSARGKFDDAADLFANRTAARRAAFETAVATAQTVATEAAATVAACKTAAAGMTAAFLNLTKLAGVQIKIVCDAASAADAAADRAPTAAARAAFTVAVASRDARVATLFDEFETQHAQCVSTMVAIALKDASPSPLTEHVDLAKRVAHADISNIPMVFNFTGAGR
jgi:hypothetical protein